MTSKHLTTVLASLKQYQRIKTSVEAIKLTGQNLDIATLVAVSNSDFKSVRISDECKSEMTKNVCFLNKILDDGRIIYGVNTGYGGSADVRCKDTDLMQVSLIEHLLGGFGYFQTCNVVRAVMLVRANSLSKACSGIRASSVELLVDMLNSDLLPRVPLRGTVSSSGDLMPTAYIAAAMAGWKDIMVYLRGKEMSATEALTKSELKPVVFQSKEALAVVNAASFSSSLGSIVLYSGDAAVLLTQIVTCMAAEAMNGRRENFHPRTAELLPHDGFIESASNMYRLLKNSKLTEQKLTIDCEDDPERLKQDRYCLRSAGQWLAPVVESMLTARKRLEIEINSANDNPLVDHRTKKILHCANFQGISNTIAMDHTRQSLQLCGKLLFAQFEEMVNVNLNVGLSPNLCGGDHKLDFGFKGIDTAMAAYCSEIDSLTSPMTSHILAAELHNQSVNSMALVSARRTKDVLEILQMMLTCNILASCQAIDLRILRVKIRRALRSHGVNVETVLWYSYLKPTRDDYMNSKCDEKSMISLKNKIEEINESVGTLDWNENAFNILGEGTRHLYKHVRNHLEIPFNRFQDSHLDVHLEKLHKTIKDGDIHSTIIEIFEECSSE